ncbi:MAG: beta-hexosaminidase, partial [Hyphomicrobiales bacterium]|nr:beta-hexosaminidase [Hyphomicrobiales bacterium]
VIRGALGFDGLLMTDDLSMKALSGPMAERARAARSAGVDLVLHCDGTLADAEAVAQGAGPLDERGARRLAEALATARAAQAAAPALDRVVAEARLAELTRPAGA